MVYGDAGRLSPASALPGSIWLIHFLFAKANWCLYGEPACSVFSSICPSQFNLVEQLDSFSKWETSNLLNHNWCLNGDATRPSLAFASVVSIWLMQLDSFLHLFAV